MMQEMEHKELPGLATTQAEVAVNKSNQDNNENVSVPSMTSVELQKASVAEAADVEEMSSNADSSWSLAGLLKSASSNQFVQKVMEKTKTGVDKMITTLDPGMTPYIRSGGDIDVVVASDKEVKWGAVRDAFQNVFGIATVTGISAQSNIAAQPVGYSAGIKGAQERIKSLKKSGKIDEKQLCVAIESFIVEQLPDHWFEIACVLLDDPKNNIKFEVFTLAVPVDSDVVAEMQKSTPSDYDLRWSGLSISIGEMIHKRLSWVNPNNWHKALTGQYRRDIIYSASLLVAELYKRRLPETIIEQNI